MSSIQAHGRSIGKNETINNAVVPQLKATLTATRTQMENRFSSSSFLPLFGVSASRIKFNLHVLRSCASVIFTHLSFVFFCYTSLHLSFGLPIIRCPPTSTFHVLITIFSSMCLSTCPNHFILASHIFSLMRVDRIKRKYETWTGSTPR